VKARQRGSKPVFDDMGTWLHAQLTRIFGKSRLAGAIRYALARMKKLRPFASTLKGSPPSGSM